MNDPIQDHLRLLNRRSFLSTAGLGVGGVALAGLLSREAKAANRVMRDGRPHPNVTAALDVGRDADTGRLFIVQELLQGMTLAKYLESLPERRLEPRAAMDLLLPILDAIGAAHAAGIVHRDLTPGNVMVREDGHAVLMDFGVAKEASAGCT